MIGLALFIPWRRRSNPIAEIERAMARNEFVPYLQPIVDIRTGRIAGAEVLIRWRKRDGSLVSPVFFVPLAESSGLIVDLTRMLMRQVCAEIGDAVGRRPGFRLGFNLAARHFESDAVVEDVRTIFGDSPIRLGQLVFEVTERQPLENLSAARDIIAALQALGCRVAIDDVGTGHGGLSYMLKLGVDCIKLDKLFVDAIGNERYTTTIIEMMVDLARNMRMEILAEGVESFEQVAHLREYGVQFAQGFVFSPPLPATSFVHLLEAVDPLPASDGEMISPGTPRFVTAPRAITAA
jgi:sensor c-di-GMP phosphodiesterase-like protein